MKQDFKRSLIAPVFAILLFGHALISRPFTSLAAQASVPRLIQSTENIVLILLLILQIVTELVIHPQWWNYIACKGLLLFKSSLLLSWYSAQLWLRRIRAINGEKYVIDL